MDEKTEKSEMGYSSDNTVSEPTIDRSAVTNFDDPDSLVGQTLDGRFLIEKNLTDDGADAGGIGLVYLARDLKLMGRQVVVKILKKEALRNDEIVRKFQHEREALMRLDHLNIVRILDFGELNDGNPFTVMEFIQGYSLKRKIEDSGQLSLPFTAHITEQVTRALAAAHLKKIVHRDIKPANIMLSPHDEGFETVRLIDFGIARVENSLLAPKTMVAQMMGTPKYISPEQLSGTLEQTPACDIYAFAIVVYEMLTGDVPFRPNTVYELLEMQKLGVQTLPSSTRQDVPATAETILLSALEYDPLKRPQSALTFGKELAAALRGPFVSAGAAIDRTELAIDPLTDAMPVGFAQPTAAFSEISPHKASDAGDSRRLTRSLLWAGLALLLLTLFAIPAGIAFWYSSKPETTAASNAASTPADEKTNAADNVNSNKGAVNSNSNTPATASGPPRELTYFLNVEKKGEGEKWGEPYVSSGEEVYSDGDKFVMAFKPDADGYFYLFNEGNDSKGRVGYNLLYPTKNGNDAARVKAGQEIKTARGKFDGGRGTETVWVVWTKDRQKGLEAARLSALTSGGAIQDPSTVIGLTKFFEASKANKVDVVRDQASKHSIVKGNGDIVVHRLLLEHK